MARPLRIEFPGAIYHVAARGNAREAIVRADADRDLFLDALGEVVTRFGWLCHVYRLKQEPGSLPLKQLPGDRGRGCLALMAQHALAPQPIRQDRVGCEGAL